MVKSYRLGIIWLIKFIPFFQTTYLLSSRLTQSNNWDNYFDNHFAEKIRFTHWYITDFTWWSLKTGLEWLADYLWFSLTIHDFCWPLTTFVDHIWLLLIIRDFRWPLMTFVDHSWLSLIIHDVVDHSWLLLITHDFWLLFMISLITHDPCWPLMTSVDRLWFSSITYDLRWSLMTFK